MALSAPRSQEEQARQLSPAKQFSSQLAAAVRSINWTYAIFWSISTSHPGVLTWKDGFYNGEIKTRKIIDATDLTADQLVLQRSEQLRELHESLSSGECNHSASRPAVSLSPEDLGDAEWYYTVCMTYAFRPGQGLPGKSFASNEQVWLCNAPFADTKIFQRALLAKSASIQTVACIPFMDGVLELGTGKQVLEDTNMVNRIGRSFSEIPFPICLETKEPSSPSVNETGETDIVLENLNQNAVQVMISGEIECLTDRNLERIMNEMDEIYGLCEGLDVPAIENNWIMAESLEVLSEVHGITNDVVTLSSSTDSSHSSCFTAWKRSSNSEELVVWVAGESQKLVKKVVAGYAWSNDGGSGTAPTPQGSNAKGHVMSERRCRDKLNEIFLGFYKSLVASIQKGDKASFLAETIAYLKEPEQRIKELESSRAATQPAETTGPRRHDTTRKKASARSKRKALKLDDTKTEREHHQQGLSKDDGSRNIVNITMMDKVLSLDVLFVPTSTPLGLLALMIQTQVWQPACNNYMINLEAEMLRTDGYGNRSTNICSFGKICTMSVLPTWHLG
ncbi:unnamed protein product [Alopecurus aequalis]